jgi:hypothetical protein
MPFTSTKTLLVLEQDMMEDDEDDDLWPGDLRGQGIEKWYIVEDLEHEKGKPDKSLGIFLEVQCPCCEGSGQLVGRIECEAGRGCEHEVEVECDTCEGERTLRLGEVPGASDEPGVFGSEWKFYGWEPKGEEIRVPERVLKALKKALHEGEDPRQIELFKGDK